MSIAPFKPKGTISVADACMEIIRELADGDGISKHVCLEEVRERTERDDVDMDQIMKDMLTASERLLDAGLHGVFCVRGSGWQRMKDADVVAYMRRKKRTADRQKRRAFRSIEAIEDTSNLSWTDRETVRLTDEARRREAELKDRRARRLRPMPDRDELASGE